MGKTGRREREREKERGREGERERGIKRDITEVIEGRRSGCIGRWGWFRVGGSERDGARWQTIMI